MHRKLGALADIRERRRADHLAGALEPVGPTQGALAVVSGERDSQRARVPGARGAELPQYYPDRLPVIAKQPVEHRVVDGTGIALRCRSRLRAFLL